MYITSKQCAMWHNVLWLRYAAIPKKEQTNKNQYTITCNSAISAYLFICLFFLLLLWVNSHHIYRFYCFFPASFLSTRFLLLVYRFRWFVTPTCNHTNHTTNEIACELKFTGNYRHSTHSHILFATSAVHNQII